MDRLELIAKCLEGNLKINRREFLEFCMIPTMVFPGIPKRAAVVKNIVAFSYDNSLTQKQLYDFAIHARRRYEKISTHLEQEYPENIVVKISKSYGNSYAYLRGSGFAGNIEIPTSDLKSNHDFIVHELTHIIANVSAGGSLLQEGLSVYIQDTLGEKKSYPNYGKDLHRYFYEVMSTNGQLATSISMLRKFENFLCTGGAKEIRTSYLSAGSFVRYLIEHVLGGDIKKFMKFYYDFDFQKHFGKPFEQLEQEWLDFIKKLK